MHLRQHILLQLYALLQLLPVAASLKTQLHALLALPLLFHAHDVVLQADAARFAHRQLKVAIAPFLPDWHSYVELVRLDLGFSHYFDVFLLALLKAMLPIKHHHLIKQRHPSSVVCYSLTFFQILPYRF